MARTRLATDIGIDKKKLDSTVNSKENVNINKSKPSRKFIGTLDCLKQIYVKNGIIGIYSGIGTAMFGVIAFRSLYLGN